MGQGRVAGLPFSMALGLCLHPLIPLHFPLTCLGQGVGFGKVNMGIVTYAQIHGWVEFRGAEGNGGSGGR